MICDLGKYCLSELSHNSLLFSLTSESKPVWISYARPTICVVFLIKGDALRSAISSLIVSSILQKIVSKIAKKKCFGRHLRFCDFPKLGGINQGFFVWCNFKQCFFEVGVMEMDHPTILNMLTRDSRIASFLEWPTSMVHYYNCARSSNSLKNSQSSDCIEGSTTSISNHGGLCLVLATIVFIEKCQQRNSLKVGSIPKIW